MDFILTALSLIIFAVLHCLYIYKQKVDYEVIEMTHEGVDNLKRLVNRALTRDNELELMKMKDIILKSFSDRVLGCTPHISIKRSSTDGSITISYRFIGENVSVSIYPEIMRNYAIAKIVCIHFVTHTQDYHAEISNRIDIFEPLEKAFNKIHDKIHIGGKKMCGEDKCTCDTCTCKKEDDKNENED